MDRVPALREWPLGRHSSASAASLTFIQGGQFQGDADDPNQVLGGDEGAQDRPDPDGFPLACLDKLQRRGGE